MPVLQHTSSLPLWSSTSLIYAVHWGNIGIRFCMAESDTVIGLKLNSSARVSVLNIRSSLLSRKQRICVMPLFWRCWILRQAANGPRYNPGCLVDMVSRQRVKALDSSWRDYQYFLHFSTHLITPIVHCIAVCAVVSSTVSSPEFKCRQHGVTMNKRDKA